MAVLEDSQIKRLLAQPKIMSMFENEKMKLTFAAASGISVGVLSSTFIRLNCRICTEAVAHSGALNHNTFSYTHAPTYPRAPLDD